MLSVAWRKKVATELGSRKRRNNNEESSRMSFHFRFCFHIAVLCEGSWLHEIAFSKSIYFTFAWTHRQKDVNVDDINNALVYAMESKQRLCLISFVTSLKIFPSQADSLKIFPSKRRVSSSNMESKGEKYNDDASSAPPNMKNPFLSIFTPRYCRKHKPFDDPFSTYLIRLYTNSSAISRPSLLYVVSTKTRTFGSILNLASDLWSCVFAGSAGDLFSVWQCINGIGGLVSRRISLRSIKRNINLLWSNIKKLFIVFVDGRVEGIFISSNVSICVHVCWLEPMPTKSIGTTQKQIQPMESNGTCFIW